ncbi:tryptophan 7-halogenase [bacterium]|nr:tryptophan 7-halogenase [bacterium]
MLHEDAEIAILGGGFAGSLLALVLAKAGRTPILIEKDRHPRFAIGESSTPLANLVLESICRTYDLDSILPLSKYGSWQKHRPDLACGLKRGFSFFKHQPERTFTPQPDHTNELLVTANPSDEVGDTHWYRENFDHFLVNEVQDYDIRYLDQTEIGSIQHDSGWMLKGSRLDEEVRIRSNFIIDATGPAGVNQIIPEAAVIGRELHTHSWSLYSHFKGVRLWHDILSQSGGRTEDHPFHCDDAALHHVLDEGWIWVLRFNNGLTSAGIVFDGRVNPESSDAPERLWQSTLDRYPSIARQFEKATPVRPFVKTGRLQRRVKNINGVGWVKLPHSAYFIDPLLSAGNAHSLMAVERLATIIERHWGKTSFTQELNAYSVKLQREIDFLDRIIHGSYQLFTNFELFTIFSMYYFAGAIFSEHRRQQGLDTLEDEFLFSHHIPFRAAVCECHERLNEYTSSGGSRNKVCESLRKKVARDIEPYNLAKLCDPSKQNIYPYV